MSDERDYCDVCGFDVVSCTCHDEDDFEPEPDEPDEEDITTHVYRKD